MKMCSNKIWQITVLLLVVLAGIDSHAQTGTIENPFLLGRYGNTFSLTEHKSIGEVLPLPDSPGIVVYYSLELSNPMILFFDFDNNQGQLEIFSSVNANPQLIESTTGNEDNGIELSAGNYIIHAQFIPNNEDEALSFTITGIKSIESELDEPKVYYDAGTVGKNYVRKRTYLTADGSQYVEETQYVDGLGRPSQRVLTGGSPTGGDLVWRYGYDSSGRQTHEWLPGVVSSGTGGYASPSTVDYGIYGNDSAPFSLTKYEASPLNRPIKKFGPGAEWQNSDIGVDLSYDVNDSTVREHRCYIYIADATSDTPEKTTVTMHCKGQYPSGSLFINTIVDEDGRTLLTFTDGFGSKKLERRLVGDGNYADTYYVYDILDNLTAVLPPEASNRLQQVGTWTSESATLRDSCFLYRYDGFNRVVGKKLPGCAETVISYDHADRPLLWQDGNLKAKGQWGFHLYDPLGREVMTGVCTSSDYDVSTSIRARKIYVPDSSLLEDIPFQSPNELNIPIPQETPSQQLCGFDLYGITLVNPKVHTITYYDDYSFIGQRGVPGENHMGFRPVGNVTECHPTVKCRMAGRLTAVPKWTVSDSTQFLATAYYYDSRGRMIQSVSANRLGGFDRVTTEYDFVGRPVATELTHTTTSDTVGIRQQWARTFDPHGRELTVRHRLGEGEWTLLSETTYDAVGRPQTVTTGPVESTQQYDIRSRPLASTSDRYSQWLDFTPGGNVCRMKWMTTISGEVQRQYDFSYDGLSRLTSAKYSDASGGTDHYSTAYEYDLNSNVTSLTRRGYRETVNREKLYGDIDLLNYEYYGNKVARITDDAPELSYINAYHFTDGADEDIEYTYDGNGNTVSDLNRGITYTTYDINNRPRCIKFASGAETRYIYDATGVKLRTEHVIPEVPPLLPGLGEIDAVSRDSVETIGGSGNINVGGLLNLFANNTSSSTVGNNPSVNGMPALPDTTAIRGGIGSIVDGDFTSRFDYTVVSATDYCGPFVYENGMLDRINLYNGYLSYRSRTGSRLDVPEYHFYLRDHLGNNRMDINAANQRNNQAMHYYPFGLPFYTDSRVTSDSRSGSQRWLFGNKELDRTSGLDLYDFEARAYDPTIIRFRRPDDFAFKYQSTSPYTYCLNNPLNTIDPDGRKIIFVNGKIGGGSPSAGAPYWNGVNSNFVKGAKITFNDFKVAFTDTDYNWFSTAKSREQAGYEYAKENYSEWISNMSSYETFKIISHSMGGAFSKGIEKYLKEMGHKVVYNIMINTFQVDKIDNSRSNGTIYIDYQNTNDPVLFWFDINLGLGELKDANITIREKCEDQGLKFIHRSPINLGYYFWEKIKRTLSKEK